MKIEKLLKSELVVRDTSWMSDKFAYRSFTVQSVGGEQVCIVHASDTKDPAFSAARPSLEEAEELAWLLSHTFKLYDAALEVLRHDDIDTRTELAHVIASINAQPVVQDRKHLVAQTVPEQVVLRLVPVEAEVANV